MKDVYIVVKYMKDELSGLETGQFKILGVCTNRSDAAGMVEKLRERGNNSVYYATHEMAETLEEAESLFL